MKIPAIGSKIERSFSVSREAVDPDARTVELSFSSEAEYERAWGIEILDHSPEAVDLGRLNSGGALLVNHSTDDQVGVVETAVIGADRKGRAVVRFGKSARASEILQDVQDGIRTLVSVGYSIDALSQEEKRGELPVYRVTAWTPHEISIVSVPADTNVGVGRSVDEDDEDEVERADDEPRDEEADEIGTNAADEERAATNDNPEKGTTKIMTDNTNDALIAERDRVKNLRAMGETLKCRELADKAIDDGLTIDQFMAEYRAKAPAAKVINPMNDIVIGLSDNDVRSFSIMRLIHAAANPNDRDAQRAAVFEKEACAAAAAKLGREARGFAIPMDIMLRDLSVGTATAGGHTVATDLRAGDFISLLRNRAAIFGLGAQTIGGLVGDVKIPRMTGGASANWIGEAVDATKSDQAFDQVSLTPKTISARTEYSRKLTQQSSLDVERMVMTDLANLVALKIDEAAIHGSGSSGQPRGVLATSALVLSPLAAPTPTARRRPMPTSSTLRRRSRLRTLTSATLPISRTRRCAASSSKRSVSAAPTARFGLARKSTDTRPSCPIRCLQARHRSHRRPNRRQSEFA